MNAYTSLAQAYDRLTWDVDYAGILDYIEALLRERGKRPETVLDLACGTGTIACLLTQRGYRVTATDASVDMLAQAAQKAAALPGAPPLFVCQSMPRLRLPEAVDAAVSTLDSLNYLTRERDLRETLRRVYRYLRPGGAFCFDVNTPHKLRRMDGQLYMDETEESVCVWRTFFSEKTQICTYQVDLFRRRADGAWDRSFEEHRERAWSRETLERLLADTGFARVRVYGDRTTRPPRPEEDRLIIRADKDKE